MAIDPDTQAVLDMIRLAGRPPSNAYARRGTPGLCRQPQIIAAAA